MKSKGIIAFSFLLSLVTVARAQEDTSAPAAAPAVVPADVAQPDSRYNSGYSFEITPYLWMAGIDGEISVGSQSADVDMSFSDLLDHVDASVNLLSVTRKDRWVLWNQLDYFALSTDVGASSSLEADQVMWTTAFGYQFPNFMKRATVDVMGGVRYLYMNTSLGSAERSRHIVDAVAVIRPRFPLFWKLLFNPTMSIGGGGSTLTYELQPQLEVEFTKMFLARAGYRRLFYNTGGDVDFEGSFQGFLVGAGVQF